MLKFENKNKYFKSIYRGHSTENDTFSVYPACKKLKVLMEATDFTCMKLASAEQS